MDIVAKNLRINFLEETDNIVDLGQEKGAARLAQWHHNKSLAEGVHTILEMLDLFGVRELSFHIFDASNADITERILEQASKRGCPDDILSLFGSSACCYRA